MSLTLYNQKKMISLFITPLATFDPPRCILPFSQRDNFDSYVNQFGGSPLSCKSFEEIDSAFRAAERYEKYKPNVFTVSILGNVHGQQVKKEFSTTAAFKTYLEELGFPVQTEEEFLNDLIPDSRRVTL